MMELHFDNTSRQALTISSEKQSIGSSPRCDIYLGPAKGVLPVHGYIWTDKDAIVLSQKLGAAARVNGNKLSLKAIMHHGDRLQLGDLSLSVRECDAPMGFREKINSRDFSVEEMPEICAQNDEEAIQTPEVDHTPQATGSAIQRQKKVVASDIVNDGAAGTQAARGGSVIQRGYTRSRRLVSLLLVGVGVLLCANLILVAR